jgi:hypothetical protein
LAEQWILAQNIGWFADHLVRDVSLRLTFFKKSGHLSVELPIRKAFLSAIQADLSCTPLFHDAS